MQYCNTKGGVLGTQHLFLAHFTTIACAFLTVIFSNCLTIGYASFDVEKTKQKQKHTPPKK